MENMRPTRPDTHAHAHTTDNARLSRRRCADRERSYCGEESCYCDGDAVLVGTDPARINQLIDSEVSVPDRSEKTPAILINSFLSQINQLQTSRRSNVLFRPVGVFFRSFLTWPLFYLISVRTGSRPVGKHLSFSGLISQPDESAPDRPDGKRFPTEVFTRPVGKKHIHIYSVLYTTRCIYRVVHS